MKRRLALVAAFLAALVLAARFAGLTGDAPAVVALNDTLSTRCDSVAPNDRCVNGQLIVRPLVLERATVIPMDRDTALTDQTVVMSDGRIVWMGPSREATQPADAMRIDASGAFVMPGLADMHVHAGRADFARYVASGITTVRNMRGGPEHLAWRAGIARRTMLGPRLYTAGPGVGRGILGNPAFLRVQTPARAREVVREQRAAGYDQVKVFNRIPVAAYEELLATAKRVGIPVTGHVVSEVGPRRSLAAGQVTFEHAESAMLAGDGTLDELATEMARAGTWVGTIAMDRSGRCAPPTTAVREVIAALVRARVRLLAGSDAGIAPIGPTEGLACELRTLVAVGLTPWQALAIATRDAGEFARMHLGEREPFGTITVGSRADLVLLDADPRDDIRVIERPRGTVLRGRWLPRDRP